MNWAHVHLLLNHIPVMGAMFGFLLLSVAVVKKGEELKKVSLGVFTMVAVAAIPVYLTGEPAEELVEHLAGVSESIIERHHEAALISLVAVEILGVMALGGLVLFRRSHSLPGWFVTTSLMLSIVIGGLLAWTANLGGQIRHTEIRAEVQSSTPADQTDDKGHEEERLLTTLHETQGGQTVEFKINNGKSHEKLGLSR